MRIFKILIFISCIISTLNCAAKKYQIKVLNTPSITIDKKEAKVGDWFDDKSVIVWSKENQAMRVVSEDNKVYTLSAKLYKESKSKTFADFIVYTKPLAARGTNNPDLIEQLAERFDQDFIMLDEIVIDLSDIRLSEDISIEFNFEPLKYSFKKIVSHSTPQIILQRSDILTLSENSSQLVFCVYLSNTLNNPSLISNSLEIEVLPLLPDYE